MCWVGENLGRSRLAQRAGQKEPWCVCSSSARPRGRAEEYHISTYTTLWMGRSRGTEDWGLYKTFVTAWRQTQSQMRSRKSMIYEETIAGSNDDGGSSTASTVVRESLFWDRDLNFEFGAVRDKGRGHSPHSMKYFQRGKEGSFQIWDVRPYSQSEVI